MKRFIKGGRWLSFKVIAIILWFFMVASCSSRSEYDHFNRGECDDIPSCVSVSSAPSTFAGGKDTFESIRLSCPDDHPYVWDWGYEVGNGVEAEFVEVYSSDINPDDEPGAEIAVEEGSDANGSKNYRVYIACSSEQMTFENMGIEEEDDDFEDPVTEDISQTVDMNLLATASVKSSSTTNYVAEGVWRQLTNQSDPAGRMLGTTYQKSEDNELPSDAILQTPDSSLWGSSVSEYIYSGDADCKSDCDPTFNLKLCSTDADCADYRPFSCREVNASVTSPGTTPAKMCMRAQDVLWNELYKTVISAEKAADITTLYPPTGRFKDAIKNAVTYLAKTGRAVTVRVAWGFLQGDASEFASYITSGASGVQGSSVTVYVARYVSGAVNWNHSKIIAADGKIAISGGQNLWDNDYLTIDPVNDVSIKLNGSAAYDAQMFAQRIWRWLCDSSWNLNVSWRDTYTVRPGTSTAESGCSSDSSLTSRPAGSGNISVIGVGRLASGIESDANQADDAIFALMRSARSSIRIIQQSITYPGPPESLRGKLDYQPWMYGLADKLLEGVHVYIVTSNDNSKPGRPPEGDEYKAYSTKSLAKKFLWYVKRQTKDMTEAQIKSLLCEKLHIARFRMNGNASAWSDGREFALHSKVYIADDMAFYVGSENFYPANLQEYGFIIADQNATQSFMSSYWDKMWGYSLRHAVTGSDIPAGRTCSLLE